MSDMIKKIATDQKLEARFIKVRVEVWQRGASLKLELYGCDKGNTGSIKILLLYRLNFPSSRNTVIKHK